MDLQKLNQSLVEIIEKIIELNGTGYDSANYDQIEEDLHRLEDQFASEYGTFLEEILQDVHDEFCPDDEVLSPIAYLARNYQKMEQPESGKMFYDVDFSEGVLVDADDYPGKNTKLVLLPNPVRLVLQISKSQREEVWTAGSNVY